MAAPLLLGVPLWAWITGGGVAVVAGGVNSATQDVGQGVGDGLRVALPLAVAATAIYLVMKD